MSNQVFSNSTQKYYAMRGVNFYEPKSGQSVANGGTIAVVNIENDQIQNDRVMKIVIDDDEYLKILEEGVYSFTSSIACGKQSGNGIYFYQSAIEAISPAFSGSLAVERLVQPAVPGDDLAYTILSVSFTGFLQQGAFIYFTIQNFGPAALNIIKENSVITACKVC